MSARRIKVQMPLTYEELLNAFRKGLRNGNWKRLSRLERALYKAALCYARIRRRIVSSSLNKKLHAILDKLKETSGMRAFRRGFEKAVELIGMCGECVLGWVHTLKEWLMEPDYILWLGVMGSI